MYRAAFFPSWSVHYLDKWHHVLVQAGGQNSLRTGRLFHMHGNRDKGLRSEERRVGKECRSRWAPDQEKKKRERENRGRDPRATRRKTEWRGRTGAREARVYD